MSASKSLSRTSSSVAKIFKPSCSTSCRKPRNLVPCYCAQGMATQLNFLGAGKIAHPVGIGKFEVSPTGLGLLHVDGSRDDGGSSYGSRSRGLLKSCGIY